MEKIIVYSALLISCSILSIGSMIIINVSESYNDFFYNISSFMFLISTLGIIIVTILLIKIILESAEM